MVNTNTFNLKTLPKLELAGLAALLVYPLLPLPETFGPQITTVLIMAILALALNVVMGSAGILHLGIAAFFGIGAYTTGILTVPTFPFQLGFTVALVASTVVAGLMGVVLCVPTLRLRGDYLALVTLGFGEVVRYSLQNFQEITNGTRSLNPLPPPTWFGWDWAADYRPFYFLCLALLVVVVLMLKNLERSRLGRAFNALREDELAATCMGVDTARVKIAAFAISSALAGLAGCLYATKLTTTADPAAYNLVRSIIIMCCVILGGMGSIRGTLVGVFLLIGYDSILTPVLDGWVQSLTAGWEGAGSNPFITFSNWRLMIFGLALILMMRFRPEGLLPTRPVQHEMHSEYRSHRSILSEESIF